MALGRLLRPSLGRPFTPTRRRAVLQDIAQAPPQGVGIRATTVAAANRPGPRSLPPLSHYVMLDIWQVDAVAC